MNDDPSWGEPPVPDVVAALLTERWSIPEGDVLTVNVEVEEPRSLSARLRSGSVQYDLQLKYRSGARDRDPWMLLVDALDGLIGQFEESGRNHRELPSGEGVEYRGASLAVEVTRKVPELQRLADGLLGE